MSWVGLYVYLKHKVRVTSFLVFLALRQLAHLAVNYHDPDCPKPILCR